MRAYAPLHPLTIPLTSLNTTHSALRAGGGRRLQTLNLSSNELHAEGLRELLGAFLAGACPQLNDLGLASNCLGACNYAYTIYTTHPDQNQSCTYAGVQGAMELGRALQAGFGPNLQRLSLASNNLGSLGLQVRTTDIYTSTPLSPPLLSHSISHQQPDNPTTQFPFLHLRC